MPFDVLLVVTSFHATAHSIALIYTTPAFKAKLIQVIYVIFHCYFRRFSDVIDSIPVAQTERCTHSTRSFSIDHSNVSYPIISRRTLSFCHKFFAR